MSLSENIFRKEFYYNPRLVEKFVVFVIDSENIGDNERCVRFKRLIFRMMKDIVLKNIANYMNLIRGIISEYPTQDELIADCYFVFDKCVDKFKTGAGYDFYYYFNKSLSRNFYREYQRLIKNSNSVADVEITDVINESTITTVNYESINLITSMLNLTPLEQSICGAKLAGYKMNEYLRENPSVTSSAYNEALNSLKNKLKELRNGK